ncbi:RNA polymerase sigma factor [Actinokineospora sp. HUAS TT18]|uniref:RNA polymerase sigma factor n=1 Tax=Actinokineospora sp. HUAS TT18 TaxID=3447451 RepID=UPI003F5223AA
MAGDESALAEAFRLCARPMLASAYRVLGDYDLAADAVQQAFVQAWRASASFDSTRQLQPWLCAIARRTAIDLYRRERRQRESLSSAEVVEVWSDCGSFEEAWEAWQVRSALAKLTPEERAVLEMAYYLGMSQRDISQTAGIALGTVKSRTARAQRRLAALLTHMAVESTNIA